ncbi:MAG: bifunctional serine/threonine-protein kinase/formylglycine-generating enzyme family protein [Bacteroidales bacterium]|nr:bifunctional serine/threonine-protein kinase/formylglycine-generating enzyme family protein [Bacteroidales bacterium]
MTLTEEYTLLQQLGAGGFATVYKARHNQLGYVRAIRMLNAFVPNEESEVYRKFLRECKVLLRLGNGNHPNIVHVYQPRLVDGRALVEMDYVEGDDLTHFIKKQGGFIPLGEMLRMVEEVSSALAYCHHDIYRYCMDRKEDNLMTDPDDGSEVLIDDTKTEQRLVNKYKVIHNDIHSGNIMRRTDGHYILLDFGLAIEGGDVVHSSRHENGAPEYKAPEKWDCDKLLTEQSDIYSFGVVMYEFLTGRVPFPYDKTLSDTKANYLISEAHKNSPPLPLRSLREKAFCDKFPNQSYNDNEVYPQGLDDIIMRCLAKDPGSRFRSGVELHKAVVAFMEEYSQGGTPNPSAGHDDTVTIPADDSSEQPKGTDSPTPVPNPPVPPKARKKWPLWSMLLVIALILVFILIPKGSHEPECSKSVFVEGIEFNMIHVEGGSFDMGCSSRHTTYCLDDESPQHHVRLNGFYMAETEVTQELWQAVMEDYPVKWKEKWGLGPQNPANNISYEDAQAFIRRISQLTGYDFRLPSEAEWEYAARGGKDSRGYRYSGSDDPSAVAASEKQQQKTSPVKCAQPNELGLYDMSGNVNEWCSDWYGKYHRFFNRSNPTGPSKGTEKVARGGSCLSSSSLRHVSCRAHIDPAYHGAYMGLRLALDEDAFDR